MNTSNLCVAVLRHADGSLEPLVHLNVVPGDALEEDRSVAEDSGGTIIGSQAVTFEDGAVHARQFKGSMLSALALLNATSNHCVEDIIAAAVMVGVEIGRRLELRANQQLNPMLELGSARAQATPAR